MQIFVQIHSLPGKRIPQTFENLVALLANIPGLIFEMDGSFVWVDHQSARACQMDGMVYDRQGGIEYIEIKGACSPHQWNTLCQAICENAIGPPMEYSAIDSRVRVHLVTKGCWSTASEIAIQLTVNGEN